MTKLISLRVVIEDRFYYEILKVLSNLIEDNPNKLDYSSFCVKGPDGAKLVDIEVKLVDITDAEGNEIVVDVVGSEAIEIAEIVKRNRKFRFWWQCVHFSH